jgi:hypothetical protein
VDKKAETTMLFPHEVNLKHCLKARLLQYQRSKLEQLLQGDNNTKYFHLVANGKHRKSCIFQLEDDGQIIKREE